MQTKWLIFIAGGVLLGFIAGFMVANVLNRQEIGSLKSRLDSITGNPVKPPRSDDDVTLSDEEIQQKISRADENPNDIPYQKGLAMALYQYSTGKQDARWLPEIARLLIRVHEKEPRDFSVAVALAGIYFDLNQNNGDKESLVKARLFFGKALELKPDDVEVHTDLGLTYLLADPAEPEKAAAEFKKALAKESKHERALVGIIQALLRQGKLQDAQTYLATLKQISPSNTSIPDFETQLNAPGKDAGSK